MARSAYIYAVTTHYDIPLAFFTVKREAEQWLRRAEEVDKKGLPKPFLLYRLGRSQAPLGFGASLWEGKKRLEPLPPVDR